jgi:hypothetical protein
MPHFEPSGIRGSAPFPWEDDQSPPYMNPPGKNWTEDLEEEFLELICNYLPDESLYALRAASPKFAKFIHENNLIRKRHVRCFFLRTQLPDSSSQVPDPTQIMGMGIALNNKGRLSCDTLIDGYLCEAAFHELKVRETVRKKDFAFFLPLAINYLHFRQIKPKLIECLKILNTEVALVERKRHPEATSAHDTVFPAHVTRAVTKSGGSGSIPGSMPIVSVKNAAQSEIDCVKVLYKFLSDAIIDYMQVCESIYEVVPAALRKTRAGSVGTVHGHEEEDTSLYTFDHAAERFLPIYWQVFHLLISLCRDNEDILRDAHDRVRQFIDCPEKRGKEYEPELGELIVVAALVFACQDEGLLPLQDTSSVGPERRGRSRAAQAAQTAQASQANRRYPTRGSQQSQPSSQTTPRDPIIRWGSHFAGPLLQEAMTRGMKQTLEASPDLQYFESGASPYRIARTWQYCRSVFRSIALQVVMLAVFSYFETTPQPGVNIAHPAQTHLDRQFGNPPRDAIRALSEEVKSVFRLSTWSDFFTKIQYDNGKSWSEEDLSSGLRQCVLLSEQRGYHINEGKNADARKRIASLREKKEAEWKRSHINRTKKIRKGQEM